MRCTLRFGAINHQVDQVSNPTGAELTRKNNGLNKVFARSRNTCAGSCKSFCKISQRLHFSFFFATFHFFPSRSLSGLRITCYKKIMILPYLWKACKKELGREGYVGNTRKYLAMIYTVYIVIIHLLSSIKQIHVIAYISLL